MINEASIKSYLKKKFKKVSDIRISKLGSGVQGSGFLIEMQFPEGTQSYVIKILNPEGLGHDYPSDRASVFLLDLDEFKNLPKHVKAIDVLAEMPDGNIKSIGGGKEYYLLMEKAEGTDYFTDLRKFSEKMELDDLDIKKIKTMADYLADIHSEKKESKTLYWRKLRDTVGHGECLMGVFDSYPDGVLTYSEMSDIVKKSVDWIAKLKPCYRRLSRIHGDFHPGNIWFINEDSTLNNKVELDRTRNKLKQYKSDRKPDIDFIVLDRSRGPWGEPADDVTALAINYIFFSIMNHDEIRGAYYQGLKIFFDEYIRASEDQEITSVVALFFAFRGVVVANPVFYPELSSKQRKLVFNFVHNVLDDENFKYKDVQKYLN